jgi:hypothetical protein
MNILKLFFVVFCSFLLLSCKKDETTVSIKKSYKKESIPSLNLKKTNIEKDFKEIDAQLNTYKKKEVSVPDEMDITAYYDQDQLVKLNFTSDYGHDTESGSFYLKNDKLFLLISEYYSEQSISGPYTISQNILYFDENVVIESLGKEQTFKTISAINMEKVPSFPNKNVKPSDVREIKEMLNYCIEALIK